MSRILLIDADRLVATNLQRYFKKSGYEVEWHVDPQVAMDAVEKKQPDLLILDLLLADRSGVEFLYEFRSYPDWQKLPVVLFSSVSEAELGESGPLGLKQLGIAAYHYKPLTPLAELGQSIRRVLRTEAA